MEENVRDLSNPVEFKAAFPVEHKECRVHKTVLPRPRKKSALPCVFVPLKSLRQRRAHGYRFSADGVLKTQTLRVEHCARVFRRAVKRVA